MKTHKEVYENIIKAIKQKVPNYNITDTTKQILASNFNFSINPCNINDDVAHKITKSLITRMQKKKLDGYLNEFEKFIYLNDQKIWSWKGSASMGAGEYWTALIMNWNFSKFRGVDLEDENGKGVDIKAVTTSVGKIPCTFYDAYGNPIEKEHGKIIYNGKLMWRKGWSFKGMYDAIRAISYCKINYPHLDKYIFYKFDKNTNLLQCIEKTKEEVEQDINSQLVYVNSKKIDLTHSLWEDGAYIYTFEEFANI